MIETFSAAMRKYTYNRKLRNGSVCVWIYIRGGQIWHFRGLVTRLFETLSVKIWLWNLTHRLMRSNEALGIFSGLGSFLVTPKWGPKEILWHVCSEKVERVGNMKFCRELCWFNTGPRNFIQLDWSIGWARIFIFPGKVGNLLFSLIRLIID